MPVCGMFFFSLYIILKLQWLPHHSNRLCTALYIDKKIVQATDGRKCNLPWQAWTR